MKIFAITTLVINLAIQSLGAPYAYTHTGPNSFDCSGLAYYCYLEGAGIELPRTAYEQGYCEEYQKIENIEDLRLGDLVFFDTLRDNDKSDHTGIYLGNRRFIHASYSQKRVIISTIDNNYFEGCFSWGRRIITD